MLAGTPRIVGGAGGGGGGPVTGLTGTPTEVVYIDNAGNGTGDSLFTRDSSTLETNIGFQTYAQAEKYDGVSEQVVWRADNIGTVGNSISLVFDGVDDIDTVLAAWNAANPSNTATAVFQTSNFVPTAQTVNFGGGGDGQTILTRDLDGSGTIQFIGSTYSGGDVAVFSGLINSNGDMTASTGALDLNTFEGIFMGINSAFGYELRTETLSGDRIKSVLNQTTVGFRFQNSSNNTTTFDVRDMEVSATIPSPLGYSYELLGDGSAGYIQMVGSDGSDYVGTIRATHTGNLIKSENSLFGSSNLVQTTSSATILYSDGSAGTSQFALASNIATLTDENGNRLISADTGSGNVSIGDVDAISGETFIDIINSDERVQTTVSGVIKHVVGATKQLTDNTSIDLFEITLPASAMTGGFFTVTITATDGTEVQSRSEHVSYAAVNKGGVYSTQIVATNDAQAHSAGTLSTSWAMTGGTNKVTISVTANSSLTVTNMEVYYQLDNNNGHQVTIL